MKSKFAGWYPRQPEQISALWDTAIFVPDANVLLHCLRHPAKVREELLRVFDALKKSLWVPYQVGLEFHRNRLDVEFGAQDAYERLAKDCETALTQAKERLRQLRAHPTINVEDEVAALDKYLEEFRSRMAAAKAGHPAEEIEKAVYRLTELLDGRVADKPKPEWLTALKKEGEDRYAKKIPPGYMDVKKDVGDKFGDLIIWKEMIAKAKSEKRPMVFITDDAKEDWLWIHRGRKLGPRPELIEEFATEADQVFHLYEFGQFLRFAGDKHPEIKVGVATIEQSLLNDKRAQKRLSGAKHIEELRTQIRQIEDERDAVISALSGIPTLDAPLEPPADRQSLRARLDSLNERLVMATKDLESKFEDANED